MGHSKNAIDMLKDYYVGDIDAITMSQKNKYKPPSTTSKQASGNNMLTFVVPILTLVLAFVIYYFAKKGVAVTNN